MKKIKYIVIALLFLGSCSPSDIESPNDTIIEVIDDTENEENESDESDDEDTESENVQSFKILSLGDSYTIGQSVCSTCRFPVQLRDSLINNIDNSAFELKIIAQTGWTTTNLISAIASENLTSDYDFVTLLIGVNNQFQNKPFSLYETEFPQLVQTAINAVQGDKTNLVVLSIPDYAFTPFGQNNGDPAETSEEIDIYNAFAESYCNQEAITFLNITDITRQGLDHVNLVASDGLHPSELAYTKFIERLLPIALEKIE